MKTVVGAIIVRSGTVLIGQRKEGSSMALKWEFPGGKLEPGETPESCLKRELFEELGIVAEIGRFFCSGTSMADSPDGIELLTYEASFSPDQVLALREHEEIRWVPLRELGQYEFPEADRPIVQRIMESCAGAGSGEQGFNRWPINRAAQRMLAEVGEITDPTRLYMLDLALWAIRSGKTETEHDVAETINAMITWRPERLMNFLLLREEDETYEPAGWEEAASPLALALIILEDIEAKMVIHFPWYRSLEW